MPAPRIGLSFPGIASGNGSKEVRASTGLLSRAWRWIQARKAVRSSTRRLRVTETVSLGEKRFVAVVQIDGLQFLLGGGPTNVTLLAQLAATEDFGELLKETMDVPKKPKAKSSGKPVKKQAAERTSIPA